MKQVILKSLMLRLVTLTVIAAAVVALVSWLLRKVERPSIQIAATQTIALTPQQITSIKALGEWEFVSVNDEEMVDTVRKRLVSNDELVKIYYGTLRIGIDLHETKPGWIAASGDSVTVWLPMAKLLDNDFIDETRTRTFHESGKWSNKDNEALYLRAHRQMKQRCLTKENLHAAQENARTQMQQIMQAMGFRHITIHIDSLQHP